MSSPSGFRTAESERGHLPQAELALLRVRIPTHQAKTATTFVVAVLYVIILKTRGGYFD